MPEFTTITYAEFEEKKRLAEAGRGRWGRALLDLSPGDVRGYTVNSTSTKSAVEKVARKLGLEVECLQRDGVLYIARPPERDVPAAAGGPVPVPIGARAREAAGVDDRGRAAAQAAITQHREDKPACAGRLSPDEDGDPHCMSCGWRPRRAADPEPAREPGTRRRGPSMAGVGRL